MLDPRSRHPAVLPRRRSRILAGPGSSLRQRRQPPRCPGPARRPDRRRGAARAREARRTLLTLDTVTGGAAEELYLSLGYIVAGAIPSYAFNFDSSRLEPTTVMYKLLSGPPALPI